MRTSRAARLCLAYFGDCAVAFTLWGEDTGGTVSVVEHHAPPS